MSTAGYVPECRGLDGEDARRTLARTGLRRLLFDSAARFRWADGFSHARALAFQIVLTLVPAIIVAGAGATLLHDRRFSDTIVRVLTSLAPGPIGDVFRTAVEQGSTRAGARSGWFALAGGGVTMIVSATTAFGQIERGANRIYGIEKDRPSRRKYATASAMAITSGLLLTVSFVLLTVGRQVGDAIDSDAGAAAWNLARWPVGAGFLVAGYAIIFRLSPRRRQPDASWLAYGAAIAVALTLLVSLLLAAYLNLSSTFGDTYGPLAGFMGAMVWSYLLSIALFLGLAFAAQLEAVRAGTAEPQSEQKVAASEPDESPGADVRDGQAHDERPQPRPVVTAS